MTNPSESFFKLVRQIQQCRRKIRPVLDVMERAGLLLDRLEQAEQAESKITQARLILDAIAGADAPAFPQNSAGAERRFPESPTGSWKHEGI